MPHEGGKTSLLTQELNNIKRQLKSGKTRSKNPRDLNAEEIAALTQKRDILIAKMAAQAKERAVNRINSHTTKEVDRIIENQRPTNETVSALGAMFLRGELPACEGQSDVERLAQIKQAKACLQKQERQLRERQRAQDERSGPCQAFLSGKRKGDRCGVVGCKRHKATLQPTPKQTEPAPTPEASEPA